MPSQVNAAMMAMQRLNLVDFDVAPDEDLPGYDCSSAPAYEFDYADEPICTYRLRQYDRKIQVLVASGAHDASSYRVTTNSFRLFSKKPDMEVLYTSSEHRQRNIASIAFVNDGPLPWRPRAQFVYVEADGGAAKHAMESRNFADWTFDMAGRSYSWFVDMRPVSLVLCEQDSSFIVARFTYSANGTAAARGAEVGILRVYRDHLTVERHGIDKLVCGLMVAMVHLKKMGRQHSNGLDDVSNGLLSRTFTSTQRASIGSVLT